MVFRILFGSLQIIEKWESCLLCKVALAGREPDIRKTKGSGVFGWSFRRLSTVTLTWWERPSNNESSKS